MQIALILPADIRSGTSYLVADLARFLVLAGHGVKIVSPRGASALRLPDGMDQPMCDLSWDEAVQSRFDAVLAFSWQEIFDLSLLDAKARAFYLRVDERYYFPPDDHQSYCLFDLACRFPVLLLTHSLAIAEMLPRDFQREITLLPAGVDGELFSTASPRVEKNGRHLRVVIEGGTENIDGVQEAFEVVRNVPGLDVWYVASDGYKHESWKPRQIFQPQSRSSLASIYASCDVLLHMGDYNGYSSTVLEAMAAGVVPIVSSRIPLPSYLRHEENFLFAGGDAHQSAILLLRRLQKQPQQLIDMQREARRTAQERNFSHTCAALADALTRAVEADEQISLPDLRFFSQLGKSAVAARENLRLFAPRSQFEAMEKEVQSKLESLFQKARPTRESFREFVVELEKFKSRFDLVSSEVARQGLKLEKLISGQEIAGRDTNEL